MCAQCMASAVTAVGAAAGLRAFAAGTVRERFGERRLRGMTVALIVLGLLAAATLGAA